MRPPAIVLLAHGSPDPDWTRPAHRTRDALRAKLPGRSVEIATLSPDDPTALAEVVHGLVRAGHTRIVVAALFLSAGGRHVKHDLPQKIAALRLEHRDVCIELVPGALGEDPAVAAALADAALRAIGKFEASGSAN